jgi:hypothetical protein
MAGPISVRCAHKWVSGFGFLGDSCIPAYSRAIVEDGDPQKHLIYILAFPLQNPAFQEQNRTTVRHTMDDIIFYQPALASKSQPRGYFPGTVTSAIASRASVASLSVRQTASQLKQQNEISNAQMTEFRNRSDQYLKTHFADQPPDQCTC